MQFQLGTRLFINLRRTHSQKKIFFYIDHGGSDLFITLLNSFECEKEPQYIEIILSIRVDYADGFIEWFERYFHASVFRSDLSMQVCGKFFTYINHFALEEAQIIGTRIDRCGRCREVCPAIYCSHSNSNLIGS